MKRLKSLFVGAAALSALFFSCSTETPEYVDITSRSVNTDLTLYAPVTVERVSVDLPSDYIRGFDASCVDYYDNDAGVKWYDTDRVQKDFFTILKNHGVNTVRLRIWNNPTLGENDSKDTFGYNSLARTLKMAGRIKSAGLKLMLDFHYSDTWTDPSTQKAPAAWDDFTTADEVSEALYNYTRKVLSSLKAIGATPDYVQIGNEINNGILLTKSDGSAFTPAGGKDGSNFTDYLSAGSKAVREIAPSAKIVMHAASSSSPSNLFSTISDVDFDIIGLSYYPSLKSHGTISNLKSLIESLISSYAKPVIIAETASYYEGDSDDGLDDSSKGPSYEKTNLEDKYTDLELTSDGNGIKGTPQNQSNVIRHIIEESVGAGACGFVTWGGERHGDWEYGMFDGYGTDCQALPSIAIFTVQGGNSIGGGKTSAGSSSSSDSSDSSSSTGGGTEKTETLYSSSYSGTGNESSLADSSKLKSSIVSIVVVATDCDWTGVASGATWWITTYSDEIWTTAAKLTWIDNTHYTATISDSDVISKIKTNGLYVAATSGMTCTLTVTITYTE